MNKILMLIVLIASTLANAGCYNNYGNYNQQQCEACGSSDGTSYSWDSNQSTCVQTTTPLRDMQQPGFMSGSRRFK